MSKGDHGFEKRAHGSSLGGYARPRTQIGFEDATRKAITKRAKQNNRSFAAEVRVLVDYALAQGGPVETPCNILDEE
jgi:hypothetical protein